MFTLEVRNVNSALLSGLEYLREHGVMENSRNGPVVVAPGPVMTVYSHPRERVLFSPHRDANPFFHFFEALWMLHGADDYVHFPALFNPRFKDFAEEGGKIWGAYGWRWRNHFGFDQLAAVIKILKGNSESRRAVISMWNPRADLHMQETRQTKDLPCNTTIYLDVRFGALNMTVMCRSNDIVWGAYGANAVHMSMLQEYLAGWLGVPVGVYRQFSNNYHAYTTDLQGYPSTDPEKIGCRDLYSEKFFKIAPFPMMQRDESIHETDDTGIEFDAELKLFMSNPYRPGTEYDQPFFRSVAAPMFLSWAKRRLLRTGTGLDEAEQIAASDWHAACTQWILRRENKVII